MRKKSDLLLPHPLYNLSASANELINTNNGIEYLSGNLALEKAHLSYELVNKIIEVALELDVSFAIRIGEPPIVNKGYHVAPKPLYIKAKTFSAEQKIPMICGTIPIDPVFRRKNSAQLPVSMESMHFSTSLRELLEDSSFYSMEYIEISGEKHLYLKANQADENLSDIQFMVRLDQSEPYDFEIHYSPDLQTSQEIRDYNAIEKPKTFPWKKRVRLAEALLSSWAERQIDLDRLYKIYYNKAGVFEPFEVASVKGIPITGDVDLLWIAIPQEIARTHMANPVNTLDPVTRHQLFLDLLDIINSSNPSETYDETSESYDDLKHFIESVGIISPYELLTITKINEYFKASFHYYSNPIQHGPDTANPNPCSMSDQILHLIVKKENEVTRLHMKLLTNIEDDVIDIADYITNNGYYIPLNPHWKNQLIWEELALKQFNLNLPVHPRFLAYAVKQDNRLVARDKAHPKQLFRKHSKVRNLLQDSTIFHDSEFIENHNLGSSSRIKPPKDRNCFFVAKEKIIQGLNHLRKKSSADVNEAQIIIGDDQPSTF